MRTTIENAALVGLVASMLGAVAWFIYGVWTWDIQLWLKGSLTCSAVALVCFVIKGAGEEGRK